MLTGRPFSEICEHNANVSKKYGKNNVRNNRIGVPFYVLTTKLSGCYNLAYNKNNVWRGIL